MQNRSIQFNLFIIESFVIDLLVKCIPLRFPSKNRQIHYNTRTRKLAPTPQQIVELWPFYL